MSCPNALRNRLGDMECPACRMSWDIFDGRPECSGDKVSRTRMVAERELGKMRQILGVNPPARALDNSTAS